MELEKMEKPYFWQNKIVLIVNAAVAGFSLWLYLSMHTMLGFIGQATFTALPYILGVLLVASVIVSLILLLHKNNQPALWTTLIFNGVAFVAVFAYFIGLFTHARSFLLEGVWILLFFLFIAIVVYLIFYFPKAQYKGKTIVAVVLCTVLVGGALFGFTDLKTLHFNYMTDQAVVYAVGTDYQIVWTTRSNGIAWVEVGEETYYDTYAGSKRSNQRVHKVTVPQDVLDQARGYTVHSKAMLSEQGYSGLKGYTVKKSYAFRPVDESDGIQAYAVADTHDFNGIVKKAASFYGQQLDFLVMAGDLVNYLESDADLSRILDLGYRITKGGIPVVFARGNHELKSPKAEILDRYVGTENENFYFTFRLGSVWGVVLDMGEDHADDWHEFYDTALYDAYRAQQLEFLDTVIANKKTEYAADGVKYRIGISHTSTAISAYASDFMYDALCKVNERLNQIKLDVMISGHLHENYIIEDKYEAGRPLYYQKEYTGKDATSEPDFLATGAAYKSVLCARRALSQSPTEKESALGRKFLGSALEFETEVTLRFTNSKGEIIASVSPFENINYGKITVLR